MYQVYSLITYLPVASYDTLAEALYAVTHSEWLFCYEVES